MGKNVQATLRISLYSPAQTITHSKDKKENKAELNVWALVQFAINS